MAKQIEVIRRFSRTTLIFLASRPARIEYTELRYTTFHCIKDMSALKNKTRGSRRLVVKVQNF